MLHILEDRNLLRGAAYSSKINTVPINTYRIKDLHHQTRVAITGTKPETLSAFEKCQNQNDGKLGIWMKNKISGG